MALIVAGCLGGVALSCEAMAQDAARKAKIRDQEREDKFRAREFTNALADQKRRALEDSKQAMIQAVTQWGDKTSTELKAGPGVTWGWGPEVRGVETKDGVTTWRYIAHYQSATFGTRAGGSVVIFYRCQGYDPSTCSQTSIEDLAAP